MQVINGNQNLLELAGTPFYCEAFTSEVNYGLEPAELTGAASETRLLALAVHRMIQREFDKGLLRNTWASVEDIESLIKDIAEYNLKEGGKDDVGDIAQYSLAAGLAEGEMEEAIQQILQLPFLTGGTEPFSPDSATLHVIREHILDSNALEDLYLVAMDGIPDPIALRNVLQLLLSVPSAPRDGVDRAPPAAGKTRPIGATFLRNKPEQRLLPQFESRSGHIRRLLPVIRSTRGCCPEGNVVQGMRGDRHGRPR
jgi:hypothetical protein